MRNPLGAFLVRVLATQLPVLTILLSFTLQPAVAMIDLPAGKVAKEANYGAMPLLFIPNQGQFDRQVTYAVQGRDKSIFFTARGLTFVLSEKPTVSSGQKPGRLRQVGPPEPGAQPPRQRWTVQLDFVNANPSARPESLEQAGTLVSYFKGRPEEWRTGLQASSRIIYRDLWPGIDLIYSGTVNRLKYDFIVHPGADPARIKLAWRGADSVQVTPEGRLAIATPLGTLRDELPVAWQEGNGQRENVAVAYGLQGPAGVQVASLALATDGRIAGLNPREHVQIVGFTVGDYDRNRTLVLDPEMLVYCGFLGGSASEYGAAIAVDSDGNAYVTGETSSTQASFPSAVGPYLSYNGGDDDAFIAKVKADGTGLVYCGFLGGSGRDPGYAIAVDSGGNAYITGSTYSTDGSFPAIGGPYLTHNGGNDAFVAKVRADGTSLVYCGFIGGKNPDYGFGIAVDSGGNAYVTGGTDSTDGSFPANVGPDLIHNGGTRDAFVAKVRADGTGLAYCGFIGGTGYDQGRGIAVDSGGNAYVTGDTDSSVGVGFPGFPVTVGPDLSQNGSNDAFVAKVREDGTGLVYCGFIGGTGIDGGQGIAVDSGGNAYVTGHTTSTESSFPVTVGPDLSHNGGEGDAFVAKVRADGTGLAYCGFIGGAGDEGGTGIAVDGFGNAYVTGWTDSTETSFPVTVGPDLSSNGGGDAFVAKIRADEFPWEIFLPAILEERKKE